MTQRQLLIAAIIASVATGHRTLAQLRHQLADGLDYVERVGAKNVEPSLLNALAAVDVAIQRIEAERARPRNN